MSSMTTLNTTVLERTAVWSNQLKEILDDELMAMQYVNWMSDFPDGDTFNIPTINDQAQVDNYLEDEAVRYRPLDTGNFTFQINKYLSSGHYITKKAMQDLYYSQQLMSTFVPAQERAIMEHVESNVLNLQAEQTSNNANTINGRAHRYTASGTDNVLSVSDFSYANLAANQANIPTTGRVAIVDPSAAFHLENSTNLINFSNNKSWEGIVTEGISTGMKFKYNVFGWDVYISNRLPTTTSDTALHPFDAGGAVNASGFKANLFFSTDTPGGTFIGAWRQMPEVDQEWNKDFQRWEFLTTARYDTALYRPEGLIVIPASTTV